MTEQKSKSPSPTSIARADRQRLAAEEGVRAMADIARDSAAARVNMERLRALRQAKEAEEATNPPAPAPRGRKKKSTAR